MKRINTLMLAIIACAAFGSAAQAQDPAPPQKPRDGETPKRTFRRVLTDVKMLVIEDREDEEKDHREYHQLLPVDLSFGLDGRAGSASMRLRFDSGTIYRTKDPETGGLPILPALPAALGDPWPPPPWDPPPWGWPNFGQPTTTPLIPNLTTQPNTTTGNPITGIPQTGNPAGGNPLVGNPAGGNPFGGNPAGGNPSGGNPGGGATAGGNPFGANPAGGNPLVGNPAGAKPGGLNPLGAAPSGGNPFAANPAGGNPAGGNPFGGNPAGGNPVGGNPIGGNPVGSNPAGGNPIGGNPAGGNPPGGAPSGGNPPGGNPLGGNPPGGNPVGGNPAGTNPLAGNPQGGTPPGSFPIAFSIRTAFPNTSVSVGSSSSLSATALNNIGGSIGGPGTVVPPPPGPTPPTPPPPPPPSTKSSFASGSGSSGTFTDSDTPFLYGPELAIPVKADVTEWDATRWLPGGTGFNVYGHVLVGTLSIFDTHVDATLYSLGAQFTFPLVREHPFFINATLSAGPGILHTDIGTTTGADVSVGLSTQIYLVSNLALSLSAEYMGFFSSDAKAHGPVLNFGLNYSW